MNITLLNGKEFEIRSLSREDCKKVLNDEKAAKDDADKQVELQDYVVKTLYGDEAVADLSGNNRDFLDVYNATVAYSLGAGEGAIKNLSRSGPGART